MIIWMSRQLPLRHQGMTSSYQVSELPPHADFRVVLTMPQRTVTIGLVPRMFISDLELPCIGRHSILNLHKQDPKPADHDAPEDSSARLSLTVSSQAHVFKFDLVGGALYTTAA